MKRKTKAKIKKGSSPKQQLFNSLGTLVALILAPLVGLFLLFRKELRWNIAIKICTAVLVVVYLPVHAFMMIYLFLVGGIYYIGPHDTLALQYLENRYHEEFVLGESTGGDSLGSSKTYGKRVTPKNNPEIEFVVRRCLGDCRRHESTEFSDTYPQKKWSYELTKQFKIDFALTSKQHVSVHAGSDEAAKIVDAHNGTIPNFYALSAAERDSLGMNVNFNETDGIYNWDTREQHAQQILKIVSFMRDAKVKSGSIDYDVRVATPVAVPYANSKDTFHFSSKAPFALNQPKDIYPLYVVFSYGRGAVKEGYEIRQEQQNVSSGGTVAATGMRPTAISKAKATRELSVGDEIRNSIAPDYLVAPYVTAVIVPKDATDNTINYKTISLSDHTVNIGIYNYPNETIPISNDAHRNHVVALTRLLQKKFRTVNLTYKSDLPVCEVKAIDARTDPERVADDCFDS